MEKFIVSARKYRPQNFTTVIGQKHITTTLKNAIANNTLAHAFLFCGPRGVGKTTCARILAKTINCENLQADGEACNECPSCVSFNNGTSLNIHELDAASNNSVDDIRELVTQIRFAPQDGKFKIYIIDEVHMLSPSAFNAFLKTLEEPPSYAKFILATTEKHKILPTILSRCQIFDFKRITNADTVEHLEEIVVKENIEADKSGLQVIAQKSEGCMRDALSILDKIVSFTSGKVTYANTIEHLNLLDEDQYFLLLDALMKQDIASALLQYDAINQRGFEGDMVLNGFAEVLRNLMVAKDERAAKLLDVLEGMHSRYAETAKGITLSYIVSALNVLNEAEISYRVARNKRLHVEIALIKLCYLQQAIDLAVTPQGQVQKKRRVDGPVAMREEPVKTIFHKQASTANSLPAQLKVQGNLPEKEEPPTKTAQANIPASVAAKATNLSEAPTTKTAPPSLPVGVPAAPLPPPPLRKPGLLDSLRADRELQASAESVKPVLNPEIAGVQQLWDDYTQKLKLAQRHSVCTSFQLAQVMVEDLVITIVSATSLNQKMIEAEATELLSLFKHHFNNFDIKLKFELRESEEDRNKVIEPRYLSSQERFRLMATEYPAVIDLKDKLKLDLGF